MTFKTGAEQPQEGAKRSVVFKSSYPVNPLCSYATDENKNSFSQLRIFYLLGLFCLSFFFSICILAPVLYDVNISGYYH